MPGFAAFSTAFRAASISSFLQRARLKTVDFVIISLISLTASKSPGLEAANPASITSTPRFSSCLASLFFSLMFMLHPGDCSPSLSVVSKNLIIVISPFN